jgi:hypothetical protein
MTATMTAPAETLPLNNFRAGVPGVYEHIPAEDYHKLRAISSTVLKRVHCDTPKHAKAALDNPDLIRSDELIIGGAGHAILLTPNEFDGSYTCAGRCEATVKSSGLRCENDGKLLDCGAWYCGVHGKGMHNQANGTVLTPDNYRRVRGIHDAVWENDEARALLQNATERELSVLWTEEDPQGQSLLCKARFDVLCREIGVLPDLKTCRSADPERFVDDAWNRGYHLQLAHYVRGGIVAGVPADLPTVIAVENEEPYDVVVFVPSRRLMDRGVEARTTAMSTLLQCERSGVWPGHSSKSVTLDLPKFVK